MTSSRVLLLSMALVLAACSGGEHGEGGEGPEMSPGEDCLQCHASGEHTFTAAGTVFSDPSAPASAGVSGVTVLITDAMGKQVSLTSNAAGNFFTSEPLSMPIHAELHRGSSVAKMQGAVPSASCASCHGSPPQNGAPGRPYVGQ